MTRYWYYYQGNIYGGGDQNPQNYSKSFYSPDDLCPLGGPVTCAIYSCPNSMDERRPIALSQNLLDYIFVAKNLLFYFPIFPDKPYAYTRP